MYIYISNVDLLYISSVNIWIISILLHSNQRAVVVHYIDYNNCFLQFTSITFENCNCLHCLHHQIIINCILVKIKLKTELCKSTG